MSEPSVWVIRTVTVISDDEKWIHTPAIKKDLSAALDWGQKTPARATDVSKLKMTKANGTKRKTGAFSSVRIWIMMRHMEKNSPVLFFQYQNCQIPSCNIMLQNINYTVYYTVVFFTHK